MLTLKHILFPVDFSECARGAARFVNAMATRFGAKVTLMSVAHPVPYLGMANSGAEGLADTEDLKNELQARLDQVLLQEFANIPVQRIAEAGEPADVITQFANAEGVDLVMMPTRGHGPFRKLLLGSVAAKVLHDAQCPVWTTAHTLEPPSEQPASWHSVVCAVDGTPKSTPVMAWAAEFSKDTGAVLRLVHAISGRRDHRSDVEFETQVRARAAEKIGRLQSSVGVQAPLTIHLGDVAEIVRAEAQRQDADLIVIGRGMLDESLGRLRTHSYGIIRQAPCPVLSV